MLPFQDQLLPHNPHIIVLGSSKVGNFLAATPTLRGLKQKYPQSTIGFIGSEVCASFESTHPSIDWRLSWDSTNGPSLQLFSQLKQFIDIYGEVALAVNLDGFNPVTMSLTPFLDPLYFCGCSLTHNRRRPLHTHSIPNHAILTHPSWDSPEFLQAYSSTIKSQYIANLFAHIAFVDQFVDTKHIDLSYEPYAHPVPDILIHTTSTRLAKYWIPNYWVQLLTLLHSDSYSIGIVGKRTPASESPEDHILQSLPVTDLRDTTTLPQLATACLHAKLVISVDSGPLHIAAATGTPTLAIYGNDSDSVGSSPLRLWKPRSNNVSYVPSAYTCHECAENSFKNNNCLLSDHQCMHAVSPIDVYQLASRLLH